MSQIQPGQPLPTFESFIARQNSSESQKPFGTEGPVTGYLPSRAGTNIAQPLNSYDKDLGELRKNQDATPAGVARAEKIPALVEKLSEALSAAGFNSHRVIIQSEHTYPKDLHPYVMASIFVPGEGFDSGKMTSELRKLYKAALGPILHSGLKTDYGIMGNGMYHVECWSI